MAVPIDDPIARINQFVAPAPQTLVLKEKVFSLSRDSFDVRDIDGNAIFRIEGHATSLSGRKTVKDLDGKILFDIMEERAHLHETYVAEIPETKQSVMVVQNSFKIMGSKATVTLMPNTPREETFTMKGNWRDTTADIVSANTGQPVARIDRKLLNKREILGGQQTYALIVEQGANAALMVAACIALDEKNND